MKGVVYLFLSTFVVFLGETKIPQELGINLKKQKVVKINLKKYM